MPGRLGEEYSGSGGDIQGINALGHGDHHGFITGRQNLRADAIALGSQDDAAISRKIRVPQSAAIHVGMSGDATHAMVAQELECGWQGRCWVKR